jgi:hypothetical protein
MASERGRLLRVLDLWASRPCYGTLPAHPHGEGTLPGIRMGCYHEPVCGERAAGYTCGKLPASPLVCLAVHSPRGELAASPLVCLAARSNPLTWDSEPVSVCEV